MSDPASVERLLPLVAAAAASKKKRRVRIITRTFPRDIKQGDAIQIQAIAVDADTGQPVKQDAFYVQILDRTGVEVYPKSKMVKDQSGFVIEISSAELPQGDFTLNVSNDRASTTNDGHASFAVREPDPIATASVLTLLPSAFAPFFRPIARALTGTPRPPTAGLTRRAELAPVVPLLTDDETINSLGPVDGKLRFVTEMDRKVCPICERYEGRIYDVNDPIHLRPTIPVHPNCRCHFEVVDEI